MTEMDNAVMAGSRLTIQGIMIERGGGAVFSGEEVKKAINALLSREG